MENITIVTSHVCLVFPHSTRHVLEELSSQCMSYENPFFNFIIYFHSLTMGLYKPLSIQRHHTTNSHMTSNNDTSLLHDDDPFSLNTSKLRAPSSLVCENSQKDYNEMHSFLDGIFSSMQTYQMEYDVESVSF
jgi:hypothetical protein